MGKGPDQREVGAADHAEDLVADAGGDLGGGWGDVGIGHGGHHDVAGAREHEPHADHVTAKAEKGEMAERQDARIAPDEVHRDGDKAEAEGLAQCLDEAGRDQAAAHGLGEDGHEQGKERETGEEDQERRVSGDEGLALHRFNLLRRGP